MRISKIPKVALWLLPALTFLSSLACSSWYPEKPENRQLTADEIGASFSSEQEFSDWMMTYYRDPKPELLKESLSYFCSTSLYSNPHSQMPFIAFLAEASRHDDSLPKAIFAAADEHNTECMRLMALHVFWRMDDKARKQMLKQAGREWMSFEEWSMIRHMKKNDPPDYRNEPPKSPTDLDMLWGTFAASGDPDAVHSIIDSVYLAEETEMPAPLIEGAAQWSLGSMMRQNDDVRAIVYERMESESGPRAEVIQALVNQYEEQAKQLEQNVEDPAPAPFSPESTLVHPQ